MKLEDRIDRLEKALRDMIEVIDTVIGQIPHTGESWALRKAASKTHEVRMDLRDEEA